MTQDYKHDYNDGQIHGWNGGDCPVHPRTRIKFWTNEGGYEADAGHCRWSIDTTGLDPDIIAFQVVKQYVEPKVIWVNEYPRYSCSFNTSEEAKKYADHPEVTRIAVKYVECIADAKEAKDD
jgi:hypothetical protein